MEAADGVSVNRTLATDMALRWTNIVRINVHPIRTIASVKI